MQGDISELPLNRPRHRLSYYFVLFALIAPVWGVVPLSLAYVLYFLWHAKLWSCTPSERVAFSYAVCEVTFTLYYLLRTWQLSAPAPAPAPPRTLLQVQEVFKRVFQSGLDDLPEDGGEEESADRERPGSPDETIVRLEHDDPRAIDFRDRLRTWFGRVPWSQIRQHEIRQWLYWTSFGQRLPSDDDMPDAYRAALNENVNLIEKRSGTLIPNGSNPSAKPMLLTLDPLKVSLRPLGWYLFVKFANVYMRWQYKRKYGLVYGRCGELEYLIRIPSGYSRASGPDPVIFIHGLGLGLWQYQFLLSHLLEELPDAPLLVPLQPQLSQDIFHPRFLRPMGRHEKAGCLVELMKELGWAGADEKGSYGATLLSHSNGSFVHAWILKSYPELITRSCFADPVTFCTWEGDVCYNFVYSTCSNGLELLMRYYVGMELGVANLLQRHFDWLNNSLWLEEIPNARDPTRTVYLLGGKDAIANASHVRHYLRLHGVHEDGLWFDPEGHHGQILLVGSQATRVIKWLKDTPKDVCRLR